MTIIIALFLIVEYLFFLVYDLSKKPHDDSKRLAVRMMAGMTGIVLVVLEAIIPSDLEVRNLILDVMAPVMILVMYPCSYEKPSISFKSAVLIDSAVFISFVYSLFFPSGHFGFRSDRLFFSCMIMVAVFAFNHTTVTARRFGGMRLFFRNNSVWYNIEDYSRSVYSLLFLGFGVVFLCMCQVPGDTGEVMCMVSAVLLMGLYAILYLKALTGRTFLLAKATESKVKEIIKGNLRTSFIDKAEEDKKMNNLYSRILQYMTDKKPFLDPEFRMDDLATELYTNKLYLSRTVNILSGRNFRQFVNYHRVQHAIALFKKDPRLKVAEAATMSGFHSTVSFNMAFKINTGKTPSEWLQDRALDRLK